MLSIDWRSPAAYRFAKSIPAAGFAWEYLRRDDDYRLAFQAITASRKRIHPATTALSWRM